MGLKIAVIGSGSTYCPELAEGFIKAADNLPLDSIYLMDINPRKLHIVGGFFSRVFQKHGMSCKVILTENLQEAVAGADYIITQIRVGEMPARIQDEKIPLKYDLIGQETTGIGGFFNALRTLPAIEEIAHEIERSAPDAWLINFSNPSGILAEYLCNYTNVKAIGLCNVPITTLESMGECLNLDYRKLRVDSVGLNHLSWYTGVYYDGKDYLPQLLDKRYHGKTMKNMELSETEFQVVSSLRAIPSSYLNYYYYRRDSLQKEQNVPQTRGEKCLEIEDELLKYYGNPENDEIPASLAKRGGHLYSQAAVSLIEALYTGNGSYHVINVQNRGVLNFLEDTDVIETTCRVVKNGIERIPIQNPVNASIQGLIQAVKQYEKLTVKAGIKGDEEIAKQALWCHPLIGDVKITNQAVSELMQAHRQYLQRFRCDAQGG